MSDISDNINKNLYDFQRTLIRRVDNKFYRSIADNIDWDIRMIGLRGPRGTGKTTLMLQRLKYHVDHDQNPLYISMEHPHFYQRGSLFETAQDYYKYGGRYLFIDEVHKYGYWSRELKVIYDGFPDMKVVFSASSALEIYRGESDLSRRVITYDFPGMSFREYLKFIHNLDFNPVVIEDILNNHYRLAFGFTEHFQPLPLFRLYMKEGYLPIIKTNKTKSYLFQLIQIINTTLIQDLQLSKKLNAGAVNKLKSLLSIIAESVPYEPNISAIAAKTGIRRETVYEFLTYLEQARILNTIRKKPKGITALQKPNKIYFENPNFNFAIQDNPETGTLRETFFLNQLKNAGHTLFLPGSKYDFLIDNKYIIEIGGRNKKIKNDEIFIAMDDIEVGFGNTIPLWLFGFLY
ncbi:MAG: ATP-binding protein [Chlorobi bacterium]|nr:ATP-binding protein [Chlorobiota bacterium]